MNTKRPAELRELAILYEGMARGAEDVRQILLGVASKIPIKLREQAAEVAERYADKARELRAAADHADDMRAQRSAHYH